MNNIKISADENMQEKQEKRKILWRIRREKEETRRKKRRKCDRRIEL